MATRGNQYELTSGGGLSTAWHLFLSEAVLHRSLVATLRKWILAVHPKRIETQVK